MRWQFPDAPELQQDVDVIAELERELAKAADDVDSTTVDESAA